MRACYNGYTFDGEQEARLYNPTLALYFLQYFQRYGQHPRKMLDNNFATDYNKIACISYLPRGQTLITKALDDAQSIQVEELADRFGVRQILRETQEESFMASVLYYLGVLTFNGFAAQGAYSVNDSQDRRASSIC